MEDKAVKKQYKARLLIAEDEDIVLETLIDFFRLNGYEVVAAKDGNEAVHKCKLLNGDIDLLLLDVTMPELNGFEVYQHIKDAYGEIPVIFSSGYSLEQTFSKASPEIPRNFIQKPYPLDDLLALIEKFLGDMPNPRLNALSN